MKIQAKRSASKKQTQIRKVAADSEINLSLLREDEEESADKREVCATSQSHRGDEKAKLRAVFFKKFLCGQVVGWLQILLDTISHDRIYFLFLCQAHCIGVFIRITCMQYNNMFTHSFILHFRGEFFFFLNHVYRYWIVHYSLTFLMYIYECSTIIPCTIARVCLCVCEYIYVCICGDRHFCFCFCCVCMGCTMQSNFFSFSFLRLFKQDLGNHMIHLALLALLFYTRFSDLDQVSWSLLCL